MQPIHLGIGIVEGLVTAAVVSFVYNARPEILTSAQKSQPIGNFPIKNIVIAFFVLAVATGGFISWFASENPDGLEWAIKKVTGKDELESSKQGLLGTLALLQKKTAFLPDYNFKKLQTKKEEIQPALQHIF